MPRNPRRAPKCTKGFPCGGSCQAKGRRCHRPLPGQFSNHVDWMASGSRVHSGSSGGASSAAEQIDPVEQERLIKRKELLKEAEAQGYSEEYLMKIKSLHQSIPYRKFQIEGLSSGAFATAAELVAIGVKPPKDGDSINLSAPEERRIIEYVKSLGNKRQEEFLNEEYDDSKRSESFYIYNGERIKMKIEAGSVSFQVDGSYNANRGVGESMPLSEIKLMQQAWRHYISQPKAKREMNCIAWDADDRYESRKRWYEKHGFKLDAPETDEDGDGFFDGSMRMPNNFDFNVL